MYFFRILVLSLWFMLLLCNEGKILEGVKSTISFNSYTIYFYTVSSSLPVFLKKIFFQTFIFSI